MLPESYETARSELWAVDEDCRVCGEIEGLGRM